MAETDYKKLVDGSFDEWTNLLAISGGRMQLDADMFNNVTTQVHVKDVNDHDVANSIYRLLPDASMFARRVESALNSAIEQEMVTSESKRFDTAYVEGFIKGGYRGADKLLSLRGLYPLNPFLDQQNCRRGSSACRFWFRIENGELIPDIMPWDTGYFVCANDSKGIAYTGYKTFRSWNQIMAEHPEVGEIVKGKENSKDIEVLNILARDTNELWVDNTNIKGVKNGLGYVPIVYRRVPMGSMLLDKDSIKFQGESILGPMRDTILELANLYSIIASLDLQELDHALQTKKSIATMTPKSRENDIPTVDQLTEPGKANEVEDYWQKMPIGELRSQAEMRFKMLQERLDNYMWNPKNFPAPRTATEIMGQAQEQDTTTMPRLANRGLLKADGAGMFIRQTIKEAEKYGLVDVKMDGKSYQVSKLKGEYTIEYKYSYKDARVDAARQSVAVGWRGMRPDSWILRNVVMSEDPDEEERDLAAEKARRESPLLDLDWKITKLLESADNGDPYAEGQAIQLAMQWIPMARQAMQGLLSPAPKEEVTPTQAAVPMLPVGASGGSQNGG